MPKKNAAFWEDKLGKNVSRDQRDIEELKRVGWNVIVVWECELTKELGLTISRVKEHL